MRDPKEPSGSCIPHGSGPWSPVQVYLEVSGSSNDEAITNNSDLAHMGGDPLVYFLTPEPPSYGIEESGISDLGDMDFLMEFDAGIEDAAHPRPVVRSVSPSNLEGFSRPPGLTTPPKSPTMPDLDYDTTATPDEHDLLSTPPSSFSRRLQGPVLGQTQGDRPDDGRSWEGSQMLTPPSSTLLDGIPCIGLSSTASTSNRGRALRRNLHPRRRSPHAWREPSPDVWAIEEETEEELVSDSQMAIITGQKMSEEVAGIDVGQIGKPKPTMKERK
ncbi:uncharacterized protein CTHT_0068170 [Thermochaetoides thermophila DSM 1495]|uniref:Uncharacterized protein n=1 Tax=Chaetomium thermophilum (strain DSM 1495 / CBS 144.50 / IMI 039719) TaxID=759272 RepID=G0SH00_CHATD|nr:hypothetical protein CTHT_0068170 [Thermochaetoides thermophila DSM 1495]EGS17489.1 hypothetical protein CTHT_0068170 [Thermochaetoides thermophila DSM 1495]